MGPKAIRVRNLSTRPVTRQSSVKSTSSALKSLKSSAKSNASPHASLKSVWSIDKDDGKQLPEPLKPIRPFKPSKRVRSSKEYTPSRRVNTGMNVIREVSRINKIKDHRLGNGSLTNRMPGVMKNFNKEEPKGRKKNSVVPDLKPSSRTTRRLNRIIPIYIAKPDQRMKDNNKMTSSEAKLEIDALPWRMAAMV